MNHQGLLCNLHCAATLVLKAETGTRYDKSLRHIAATSRLVCTAAATRLLALSLSLRSVARIQTSLNSCDRSQRQNSVAAIMIFTCHTRRFVEATSRGDVSQRFVASCVSALREQLNFKSAVIRSKRSSCFIIFQGVRRKITDKWLEWLRKERSCKFSLSDYLLTQLSDYIKACIRLTWRMVTQVPPMQLEYQSSTLKGIHINRGYHSSPEMCSRLPTHEGQEEQEIACYLWPALLDGGGKLIRAGEVLCKVKEETTMI